MAKKFVRGITDIKNIEHQGFDTNNVNDLLSDGKHNFIHRKKNDGSEEYHNLTNNLKTIQSDNTDLVSVTNYNNTNNSATIRPKHDSQKEQVLESSDETILISHGENGTEETTSVDINPKIVLEHDNLISTSQYVTIEHEDDSNTSVISTDVLNSKISEIEDKIPTEIGGRNLVRGTANFSSGWAWNDTVATISDIIDNFNVYHCTSSGTETTLNNYDVRFNNALNVLPDTEYTLSFWVKGSGTIYSHFLPSCVASGVNSDGKTTSASDGSIAHTLKSDWERYWVTWKTLPTASGLKSLIPCRQLTTSQSEVWLYGVKLEKGNIRTDWTPAPEDFDSKLAQKQNTLTSNTSIGVDGTGLMQLYSYQMSYSNPLEGSLNTYAKTVQKDTTLTADPKLEYHFTAKLNEAIAGMTVELEDDDETYFTSILTKYGEASGGTKTAMINGLIFTLNGSQLTVSRDVSSTAYIQVVSFSDIIDPSQDTTQ